MQTKAEDRQVSLKPIIGSWILIDSQEESSYYPQTGIKSSSDPRVHDMYWRCVVCFFATVSRLAGDKCRPVLYTSPGTVIPYETQSLLDDCGVQIERVKLEHLPPPGYFGMWRNQFYILDVIRHMARFPEVSDCMILDSDCLLVSGLDKLFAELDKEGVLTYGLRTPVEEDINGLSRSQMKSLFEEMLGRKLETIPEYYGGEFFAATGDEILRLNAEIDSIWSECLRRASAKLPKLNEEAHFLSYLYLKLGYKDGTANSFIRRIWTQRRLRDGIASDMALNIWHLPAEKRFGYRELYPLVVNRGSWFWVTSPGLAWKQRIARLMGIPRPTVSKKSKDFVYAAWARLSARG
jgi:hypothetical protein